MDEEDEHFLSASHRKCILLSGTECHIINYLLTELARAVPGNIGPRSFLYGPSAARSVLSRPRANIPQYGPRARLVGSLSTRVFETRTATGREHSVCQDSGVSHIFILIIHNREKVLSIVNVICEDEL